MRVLRSALAFVAFAALAQAETQRVAQPSYGGLSDGVGIVGYKLCRRLLANHHQRQRLVDASPEHRRLVEACGGGWGGSPSLPTSAPGGYRLVTPRHTVSTLAMGEEGSPVAPPATVTTLAMGEEGSPGGIAVTLAIGEGAAPKPVPYGDSRRRAPVFGDSRRRRTDYDRRRRRTDYVDHAEIARKHEAAEKHRLEGEEKAAAKERAEKEAEAEAEEKKLAEERAIELKAKAVAEALAKEQAAAREAKKKEAAKKAAEAEAAEKTTAAERKLKAEQERERVAKEKEEKAEVEERALKAWEKGDKSEKAGKAAAESAAKEAVREAKAKAAVIAAEKAEKVSAELAAKAAAAAEKLYKEQGSEKAHKDYSEKLDKASLMNPTPPPTPLYSGCHAGGWFEPSSVVSATCASEQRPKYDPGAFGGEPAGTCMADESANAGKLLTGGETYLRAASGSGKTYTFVYAFDGASWIRELHLAGRSTGAFHRHNDNRFAAAFSLDGKTWSDEHALDSVACQVLGASKCTLRLARQVQMQYVKLVVRSSCAGCSNADYVTSLRVKCADFGIVDEPAPPVCKKPVPERCTLLGVPSLRLGSNTCAWGLVQLGPLGLRFTASKCVSRRNFCGALRDNSCGPSVSPVASRLTITTLAQANSYINLHEDGTMDFEVAGGGCVNHITAAPAAAAGAHFQDPARGTDAYILYDNKGLQIHSSALSIDCAAVSCSPTCCHAEIASCLACKRCTTVDEYCAAHPKTVGCDRPAPTKPPTAITLAVGEDGKPPPTLPPTKPPTVITTAVGEDGKPPTLPPVTLAVGEDGKPPPAEPCPAVMCRLYCEHGFEKDSKGCQTCVCKSPPKECNPICCHAEIASCLACKRCTTVDEYCAAHPKTVGCDRPAPTKPPTAITLAVGEDGKPPPTLPPTKPPTAITLAVGEDGKPPPTLPPTLHPACAEAHCPHGYGFKKGCAWHGDCMPEVNVGTPNDMNKKICEAGPWGSPEPGVWCESSDGKPVEPCAPVLCKVHCEHGFEEDSRGCQTCVCKRGGRMPTQCADARCPHMYGFKAGCAFHGDCVPADDEWVQSGECLMHGGAWCDPSGTLPPPGIVITTAVGEDYPRPFPATLAVGEEVHHPRPFHEDPRHFPAALAFP